MDHKLQLYRERVSLKKEKDGVRFTAVTPKTKN